MPAATPGPSTCATPGCHQQAETILIAGHPSGVRCRSRRCRPCAARLACRYLLRGYAVHLSAAARRRDSA